MIERHQTLNEVAAAHPMAATVLVQRGFELCCGGHERLADACQRSGQDPDEIIREILGADEQSIAPAPVSEELTLPELIAHLHSEYHPIPTRDLPFVCGLASKVERVHAQNPRCPAGLADVLTKLSRDLQLHMTWEQHVLFPALHAGDLPKIENDAIQAIRRIEAYLRRVREITDSYTVPAGACASWHQLFLRLRDLDDALANYIHLEQHCLLTRLTAA